MNEMSPFEKFQLTQNIETKSMELFKTFLGCAFIMYHRRFLMRFGPIVSSPIYSTVQKSRARSNSSGHFCT